MLKKYEKISEFCRKKLQIESFELYLLKPLKIMYLVRENFLNDEKVKGTHKKNIDCKKLRTRYLKFLVFDTNHLVMDE